MYLIHRDQEITHCRRSDFAAARLLVALRLPRSVSQRRGKAALSVRRDRPITVRRTGAKGSRYFMTVIS